MIAYRFWRVPGGWRFKLREAGSGGYVSAPCPSLPAAVAGAWRARKELRT